MMQPILAEFCGRWGCTWWEGILTVIFISPGGVIILLVLGAALLLVSAVLPLLLIGALTYQIGAITSWFKGEQKAKLPDKFQQQDKRILSTGSKLLAHAAKVLAPSDENAGKSQQQDEHILSAGGKLRFRAVKFLERKKNTND